LKENTNIARLRAYRNTKDIGLRVSGTDKNISQPVKLKGHIKITNPLRLSVKDVNVDTILKNLDTVENKSIIKDKDLIKELIKDLKFEIYKRNYAFETDTSPTKDELELINRSKSFVVRDALLKLGFDSIEYLPEVNQKAFVLLKENQFYPTNISTNRKQFKDGGLLTYLIEKGDTLYSIAKRNKMSLEDILKLNPQIKDANKIFTGQEINLKPREEKQVVRDNFNKKEFSIFKDVLGFIPLNIKQLFYDVAGGDAPITEKDLRDSEKQALIDLTKRIKEDKTRPQNNINRITYADYGTTQKGESITADVGGRRSGQPYVKSGIQAGEVLSKFKDPYYSLKTTLGQASIVTDEEGNTIIKDRYNFNDNDGQITLNELYSDMRAVFNDPFYNIPRKIGKYFGSAEGEGSPVEINLGKII